MEDEVMSRVLTKLNKESEILQVAGQPIAEQVDKSGWPIFADIFKEVIEFFASAFFETGARLGENFIQSEPISLGIRLA
ncbi:MAG: hypothetical protein MUQ00_13375 [Candidatus Aminicenantes bacterium]|nr:hypothetical protein [Candidatus Aminicenantes bacterium]